MCLGHSRGGSSCELFAACATHSACDDVMLTGFIDVYGRPVHCSTALDACLSHASPCRFNNQGVFFELKRRKRGFCFVVSNRVLALQMRSDQQWQARGPGLPTNDVERGRLAKFPRRRVYTSLQSPPVPVQLDLAHLKLEKGQAANHELQHAARKFSGSGLWQGFLSVKAWAA